MHRTALAIAAVVLSAAQMTHAQAPARARPAAPAKSRALMAIDAASNAIGILRGVQMTDALVTIRYSATGTMYDVRPPGTPAADWPASKITAYTARVAFDVPGMRVEYEHAGAAPGPPSVKATEVVGLTYAWNENAAGDAQPMPALVRDRLLQIWMLPAGALKAARAAGDKAQVSMDGGFTVLTFPVAGTTEKIWINDKQLIERVEVPIRHPVLGDTVIEASYSGYADLGDVAYKSDVLFPAHIVQKLGGKTVLDLNITIVNAYNPYVVFPIPENVERASGGSK
jgi:hypothetical protein